MIFQSYYLFKNSYLFSLHGALVFLFLLCTTIFLTYFFLFILKSIRVLKSDAIIEEYIIFIFYKTFLIIGILFFTFHFVVLSAITPNVFNLDYLVYKSLFLLTMAVLSILIFLGTLKKVFPFIFKQSIIFSCLFSFLGIWIIHVNLSVNNFCYNELKYMSKNEIHTKILSYNNKVNHIEVSQIKNYNMYENIPYLGILDDNNILNGKPFFMNIYTVDYPSYRKYDVNRFHNYNMIIDQCGNVPDIRIPPS